MGQHNEHGNHSATERRQQAANQVQTMGVYRLEPGLQNRERRFDACRLCEAGESPFSRPGFTLSTFGDGDWFLSHGSPRG